MNRHLLNIYESLGDPALQHSTSFGSFQLIFLKDPSYILLQKANDQLADIFLILFQREMLSFVIGIGSVEEGVHEHDQEFKMFFISTIKAPIYFIISVCPLRMYFYHMSSSVGMNVSSQFISWIFTCTSDSHNHILMSAYTCHSVLVLFFGLFIAI
jgi:hypothetical protein